MQSILTRQKVYDPIAKKTVEPGMGAQAASDPRQMQAVPANNSQAIFDKIAQSMQYANAYDLGTVALENRFGDFDRMSELKEKAEADKRRKGTQKITDGIANAAEVDSQDFINDLDAMQRQRNRDIAPRTGDESIFALQPPATIEASGAD